MTAVGAVLALLVVLYLEGIEVRYAAPADPDLDVDELGLAVERANFRVKDFDVGLERPDDEPELVTDGGVDVASPGGGGPSSGPNPWQIIDAIKDAHRGVDVSGGLLPSLVLPGFGGKTRMKCGDYRPQFCPNCGDPSPGTDTCDRSTCQHCAPNWARRRATEVCRKLEAWKATSWRPSAKTKHHHLTISPAPRGEVFRFESDDALQRAFDTVGKIMDELGIQGYVIYHPYRAPGEPDNPFDHLGFWKDVVFNNRDWNDVRDELEYSPHFHVIAVSDFVQGEGVTDVVHGETGWVIHRITEEESNRSIDGKLSLARVVTYCLSHAGIYETDGGRMRVATRWYGFGVRSVDKKEEYRRQWERIVRTVATRTLGLNKRDLLCDNDVVESSTQVSLGTFDAAQAQMHADGSASSGDDEPVDDFAGNNVDATGEVTIGSSGPADLETSIGDVPDTSVDVDVEVEPCEGPLYDIRRAPDYLSDDEWCEEAPYADELAEEYEQWRRAEDFFQHLDNDLELIQQGRGDETRIDWPPPD